MRDLTWLGQADLAYLIVPTLHVNLVNISKIDIDMGLHGLEVDMNLRLTGTGDSYELEVSSIF